MPIVEVDAAGLEQRTTILLAEDNEDDILLIEAAFKEAKVPYQLEVVEDGALAIQYLKGEGLYANRSRYPMPFLVLLDLKMPVMNGWELVRVLRSTPGLSEIPVLFVTAVTNAHRVPAGPVFLKPLDMDSLVRAVKIHAGRSPD